MFLEKLSLLNFKNYEEAELLFSDGANAFVGGNGEGKTNLLDAIHYLSMCKSYFQPLDMQNIRHGTDFFAIQGLFRNAPADESIYCGLKKNQRKIFRRNQKEYSRLAGHIGLLPVVMISPVDTLLITEGSEERRKFADSILSQLDRSYLDDLIIYNRALSQRNALLKAQTGMPDPAAIDIWNEQLIPPGKNIFEKRQDFIARFMPVFTRYYEFICAGREQVNIRYESQLHDASFADLLGASLEKDRIMQYTTAGIHKDDFVFLMDGYPVKRLASQGQQKSFLIALKLAQFDLIREEKKMKPILLLDDIFDKLDDLRVKRLMELVSNESFGQIFITDTHPVRVSGIFEDIAVPIKTFTIYRGVVNNQVHTLI